LSYFDAFIIISLRASWDALIKFININGTFGHWSKFEV